MDNELARILIERRELLTVMRHLKRAGIDYGKSISRNTGLPLQNVLEILDKLEKLGLIERVQGKVLKRSEARYKLSNEVRKHHVYYRLSRQGELILRELRSSES
jgi:Uncharacterized protein conserved in archaea